MSPDREQREQRAEDQLVMRIIAVLEKHGPDGEQVVRDRILVASDQRWKSALNRAVKDGLVKRNPHDIRLPGDRRSRRSSSYRVQRNGARVSGWKSLSLNRKKLESING